MCLFAGFVFNKPKNSFVTFLIGISIKRFADAVRNFAPQSQFSAKNELCDIWEFCVCGELELHINMKKIRVGSRESRLAVIQAQMVIDAIKKFDPTIETELVTMKTTGDKLLSVPLDKVGGKGLFVKELDLALLNNEVDITVHSFKDMPAEINPDLPIVALSQREDPRDALILPLSNQNTSMPIGCSSQRRKIQLKSLFDGVEITPIRGNVLTRLEKLDRGEYSSIVLAAAGLKRLGLENHISRLFSIEEMLPASCQGIIAVQARKGEDTEFLRLFDCEDSHFVSLAERSFIRVLDGGCSSPVAAFAQLNGNEMLLKGMYVDIQSGKVHKGCMSGDKSRAEFLGNELALELMGDVKG